MNTILQWVYFEMPSNVNANMISNINTNTFGMVNITADIGLELFGGDYVGLYGWNFGKTINFNVSPQCYVNWYMSNIIQTASNVNLTSVYNLLTQKVLEANVWYSSEINWNDTYIGSLGINFIPYAGMNISNYNNTAGITPIQQYSMTSTNLYAMIQPATVTTQQKTIAQTALNYSNSTQISNVSSAIQNQNNNSPSYLNTVANDLSSLEKQISTGLGSIGTGIGSDLSGIGGAISSEFTPLATVIKYLPYMVVGVGALIVGVIAFSFNKNPESTSRSIGNVMDSTGRLVRNASVGASMVA